MPQMQILRLLVARHTVLLASQRWDAGEDDEGPFFDLDFSSCSVRASSYSSGSLSGSDSDDNDELDFIISLQRNNSDLPFFSSAPPKFCPSEQPTRANSLPSQRHGDRKRSTTLCSLSFGARKATPLYRRPSFARSSSSSRLSFARSSTSSARSLRLFMDSPPRTTEQDEDAAGRTYMRALSRDVIRRCLAKISCRIRTAASPRAAAEARGIRGLRKRRSASSVAPLSRHDDDSAVEKQDGIAGAIAHCKESLH